MLSNFKYAVIGIKKAFNEGPIIKIIATLGFLTQIIALILHFSILKIMIITLGIAISLCLEMMNSALESVVDATKIYNEHTRDAKDMGSGSVLLFGIFSLFIGIMLFYI